MTITNTLGAVQTHTYDANGNLIREVSTSGGVSVTYTITITSTEKVCR